MWYTHLLILLAIAPSVANKPFGGHEISRTQFAPTAVPRWMEVNMKKHKGMSQPLPLPQRMQIQREAELKTLERQNTELCMKLYYRAGGIALNTRAEAAWAILVIVAAVVLFLIMIFAWVVALMLSVAASPWYLCLIPVWVLDTWALNKLMKYVNRKWGAE